MSIIEALILGLVQGLTEFLPVSSSGHIELGAYLLGVKSSDNLLFSIVVHGATALSTMLVFRKYIVQLISDLLKFQWNDSTVFILKIAISMIPLAFVGIFFEDIIETLFTGRVLLVAYMLAITGTLLVLTHFSGASEKGISYSNSFVVGVAQAFAILPGISRSGATIATALLLGVNKTDAARFSFLMVLPPILGATLIKTIEFTKTAPTATAENVPLLSLVFGFIAAFIAGLLACHWMIGLVKRGKLIYFALYCFAVSITAILMIVL